MNKETEVLAVKNVSNGQIGLVKLKNKYSWRYKNFKYKFIQNYSRKKFHSLKAFEKYIIMFQEKLEKEELEKSIAQKKRMSASYPSVNPNLFPTSLRFK